MTTTAEPRTTLPAVECAPWCDEGDGHTDERFVSDQTCSNKTQRLELTSEPLLMWEGKVECRAFLHFGLHRDAYSTRTIVDLIHNEEHDIHLTLDEAESLGRDLLELVRQARA